MSFVVPAVLPSSREDLEKKLALFTQFPSVSRVQIDVVDGRFATPASWPYGTSSELGDMVERGEMLPHLDRFEYEIDLMCLDTVSAAGAYLALGASRLTFHAETATNPLQLLKSARKRHGSDLIPFGLALNVASDLALIEPCISEIEYVQFMGIARIGRQGQPLNRRVFENVRIFHERHPEIPMQVDGGVSLESAKELVALGVSNLVIGSAILRADNPIAAFAMFEALENPYGV